VDVRFHTSRIVRFNTHFSGNRAGGDYRGEYVPRRWLRTVFGGEVEYERASVNSDFSGFIENNKGIRRNAAAYVQQSILRDWFAMTGGVRFVHNQNFGETRCRILLQALHRNEMRVITSHR